MLVDYKNRIPEQRTLNPRGRSRWPSALSLYLRDLAAAGRSTRRAGSADRASATRASGPARFPCSARPLRNQTRAASSPGTHAEHPAPTGAREKPSAGTSELHARAAPHTRGSGMAVRMPRAARHRPQRAAPPAEQHARMPCRHVPAARPDGPHNASRPTRAREFPEIHPPAQAPPPPADRNARPRCPPGTPGSRQPRHSRPCACARWLGRFHLAPP